MLPTGHRDRVPDHPAALFVYGTLTFADVLQGLLGRLPASSVATADGWRRAALRGRSYPGLVPGEGSVAGLVLTDLSHHEWAVIDAFEGEDYDLRAIDVDTGAIDIDTGAVAWTYVWRDGHSVLRHDWDRNDFAARHLATFARRCAEWHGR